MLPQPFFIGILPPMSTCLINPQRGKGEPQLPPTGVLAVNPSDASCFAALAKERLLKKFFLFNAQLYSNQNLFLAGPAVGAPMAVLCLEKLIALGARRIVVYGWCGSLSADLRVGDLFLPTAGLSEEGVSRHYPAVDGCPDDATLRLSLGEALKRYDYRAQSGPIWTTDAVYRETREKVARYGGQGIMAVDMEYTALRAVAAFRQVNLAAVMMVSDELFHPEWAPQFQYKKFRADSQRLLATLCAILSTGETS